MSERKRIKASRPDISDWLTHFTRDTNGPESAKGNLWGILCDGFLKPTWALRGGKRTVWGEDPAVCFTEMPLGGFQAYVDARGDSRKLAPYGVLVKRSLARKQGARPVIYALSGPRGQVHNSQKGGPRVMTDTTLPLAEQYRFVEFDGHIDWTHEREWRWASRDASGFQLAPVEGNLAHFFVNTREEATRLRERIQKLPQHLLRTRLMEEHSLILSLEELGQRGSTAEHHLELRQR